ncbi:MAG: PAS domain-containing protein, partial [Mariprofundaceae bacterium]|nr:PAS domain-containing protein [Mariprofundaceae bacterium]
MTGAAGFDQLLRWEIVAGTLLALLLIGSVFTLSLSRKARQRSAELQSIFDHMQEVLYRTDGAGRILMVTPSLTPLTGFTPKEV